MVWTSRAVWGPVFCAQLDESGGTPFRILLVRWRHMLFEGGVSMGQIASDMAGHALAFSEGLHGVGGQPDVELFALSVHSGTL